MSALCNQCTAYHGSVVYGICISFDYRFYVLHINTLWPTCKLSLSSKQTEKELQQIQVLCDLTAVSETVDISEAQLEPRQTSFVVFYESS